MLPPLLNLVSYKNGKRPIFVRCDVAYGEGGQIILKTPWDPYLPGELKVMQGARWHPEENKKYWSINNSYRNLVALQYMQGINVYKMPAEVKFDTFGRPLYNHQFPMVEMQLGLRRCLNIGEMGVGKTLAVIVSLENIMHKLQHPLPPIWYIAPRNALEAAIFDFHVWKCGLNVKFMTYEGAKKRVNDKLSEDEIPFVVVLDEISRLRNPGSQRSKAIELLLEGARVHWGNKIYVWGLTGTPSPKNPLDWFNLAELTNPGFVREGKFAKFRDRLAIVEQMTVTTGQTFPKILGWRDSIDKCDKCGKLKNVFEHDPTNKVDGHTFEAGRNEVSALYGRLKNIAIFTLKKDCLQLPEKIYRIVKCQPTRETLELAQIIKKTSDRAITALIHLRELSDGFKYTSEQMEVDHEECAGSGCSLCLKGKILKQIDGLVEYVCPKDEMLAEELEDIEKRIIIYAAFTESIDKICRNLGLGGRWRVIRLDGRGWFLDGVKINPQEALTLFKNRDQDEIAIVANQKSAGMGLTLTASDTIIYYSNSFDAEDRIQSEDRIHRPGSRGANIIDLVHLPTDIKVLRALKEKRDLQNMTMGNFDAIDITDR